MNHESLLTLGNKLRASEGRGVGYSGDGYLGGHVLHGALGVIHK